MALINSVLMCGILCCVLAADFPILGAVINAISTATKDVVETAIDTVNGVRHETDGFTKGVRNKILETLENFRRTMSMGVKEIGIPILEPFRIKHIELNFKSELGMYTIYFKYNVLEYNGNISLNQNANNFSVNGTLDNMEIHKLSTFKVQHVEVNPLKLAMLLNLTFDEIPVSGQYNINAVFGELFNVHGNGPFTLTIYDVDVGIAARLAIVDNSFVIDELHLTFGFKSMKNNFENLMGGGENGVLFNNLITKLGPEAIKTLWPEIEPVLSDRLKQILVISLSPNRISRLIQLINGDLGSLGPPIG